VDVVGDRLGHPGVAGLSLAAVSVLPAHLEEPHAALLGLLGVFVARVAHLVGAEAAPTHQLDGDLPLPVVGSARSLQPVEFVLGEPALRHVLRIVDSRYNRK
jgi:hypothetical protein